MNLFKIAATLLILAISAQAYAVEESVKKVTSRGVVQKFILTKPDGAPKASLVLLAGGHGKLSLGSFFGAVSVGWGQDNFVVRTRKNYAKKGFLVATVDAPADKSSMNAIWRMSDDHAKDIAVVVGYLKQLADVPVWIIGTSMGSFSAANIGIRLNAEISGVVFTSSITRSSPKWAIYYNHPNGVMDMALSKITVPVLVVSHKDDGCTLTPAADITKLAGKFTASKKVEETVFSGGHDSGQNPCYARTHHGFLGIEKKVVKKISLFIQSN